MEVRGLGRAVSGTRDGNGRRARRHLRIRARYQGGANRLCKVRTSRGAHALQAGGPGIKAGAFDGPDGRP